MNHLTPFEYFEVAYIAVIFVFGLMLNTLPYLIFAKNQQLLTKSNKLVLNLCLCNVTSLMITCPAMVISILSHDWMMGPAACQVVGFCTSTVFGASSLTMVIITMDRYHAVVSPLHYQSRSQITWAGMVVWVLALLSALQPLIGWSSYHFDTNMMICTPVWGSPVPKDRIFSITWTVLFFFVPLGIMLWAYNHIFSAAKGNLSRTKIVGFDRNSTCDTEMKNCIHNGSPKQKRRSMSELVRNIVRCACVDVPTITADGNGKVVSTSLLVVATFVITWLPYYIVIMFKAALSQYELSPCLQSLSVLMALTGCVISPMVYVFRNDCTQVAMKKLFQTQRFQLLPVNARDVEAVTHSDMAIRCVCDDRSEIIDVETI